MAQKRPAKKQPDKQSDGKPAIVEDESLPRMGELELAPAKIKGKIVNMPEKYTPYRGTRNLMDPVPSRKKKAPATSEDQEEAPVRRRGGQDMAEGSGYVRLRIRVEDGELSVVGASLVEGPLTQTDAVHPGLNYEVKVGRRRVALGDAPDNTEMRSYPDPLGRPGLDQHHVMAVSSYEFTARVPAEALNEEALPNTKVELFRVEGQGPGETMEARDITKQPKGVVTTVGVLRGIELADLPKSVERDLRRAVK